jgi:hypothetical protein
MRSISMWRTGLAVVTLVVAMQTAAAAQSVQTRDNSIVGVYDVQVAILNCTTGAQLASFRGLNKFELGGTAQVVPSTSPTALSAHMGVWKAISKDSYQLTFKMFRFDPAGTNIGWQVVRFDITLNEDASGYAGIGHADVFDTNGNVIGASCPTLTGTRFQ